MDGDDAGNAAIERTVAELVGLLRDDETYDETLGRVVSLAVATVPGCAEASVTLLTDDRASGWSVVSTGDLALAADEAQYASSRGPCLDAARTGGTYEVTDMAAERRWGDYPARAVREGVRSSLSHALTVHGTPIGALNLYGRTADAFTPEGRAFAALFATQAAVAIANGRVVATTRRLAEQLRSAMATRAVIEQAKGILMAERGCDEGTAFGLLRSASQRQNVKLRDVAAGLVESAARGPRSSTVG